MTSAPLAFATRTRIALAAFAAALFLVPPGIVLAGDDKPTLEERARIERALVALGFTSWDEIEREDDGRVWEVDNARMPDGSEWDLKLSADDLRVLKRERD